ncbi:MAG: GNAT family N-acetyltransferase [Chloroflexota bacterium]
MAEQLGSPGAPWGQGSASFASKEAGLGAQRGHCSRHLRIKKLTERQQILEVLSTDRLYAAYAIGDLEPGFFEECAWYGAESAGRVVSLCLHYRGLYPNAFFTVGEEEGVRAILSGALGPWRAYFSSRYEHLPALREFYNLGPLERLIRLAVTAERFKPVATEMVRLGMADIHDLNRLYHIGGGGSVFTPYQLDKGVYFGVRVDGELVSVAGTHVVAPGYGIAAVGNVLTHPGHRNRGYATACTSAVVQELLRKGCAEVVLNVREDNWPAIKAYTRLGFQEHCRYVEALGCRKFGHILSTLWHWLTAA